LNASIVGGLSRQCAINRLLSEIGAKGASSSNAPKSKEGKKLAEQKPF
jgi:hypothetical protein